MLPFLLYFSRSWTLVPLLKPRIEGLLGDTLGGEFHIGKIRGSWLSDIEITDVRTLKNADRTPVKQLRAASISAEYSLWDLVRGNLEGLHQVRTQGLQLHLDLRQGEQTPPSDDPFLWPESLPKLDARKCRLHVTGEDFEITLPEWDLQLNTGPVAKSSIARLQLRQGRFDQAEQSYGPFDAQLELEYRPAQFRVLQFDMNGVRPVQVADLDLTDSAPALEVQASLDSDSWSLITENFPELADSASLTGPLQTLDIDLSLKENLLSCRTLRAETEEVSLYATDFRVPLQWDALRSVDYRMANGSLELEARDLESVLNRIGVEIDGVDLADSATKISAGLNNGALEIREWDTRSKAAMVVIRQARLEWDQVFDRLLVRLPVQATLRDPQSFSLPDTVPPLQAVAELESRIALPTRGTSWGDFAHLIVQNLSIDVLGENPQKIAIDRPVQIELENSQNLSVSPFALQIAQSAIHLGGHLNLDFHGPVHLTASTEKIGWEQIQAYLPKDPTRQIAGGSLALDLSIEGSFENPVIHASCDLTNLQWNNQEWDGYREPVHLQVQAGYEDGRIRLESGTIRSKSVHCEGQGAWEQHLPLQQILQGSLRWEDIALNGALAASLHLQASNVPQPNYWIQQIQELSSLEMELQVQGNLHAPIVSMRSSANGRLQLDEIAENRTFAWELQAKQEGKNVLVQPSHFEIGSTRLGLSGNLPIEWNEQWVLGKTPLDFRLGVEEFSLQTLREWLPQDTSLPLQSGRAACQFTIGGTWKEPRLEFLVEGDDLSVATAEAKLAPEVFTFHAKAVYENQSFSLHEFSADSQNVDIGGQGTYAIPIDFEDLLNGQLPNLQSALDLAFELRAKDLAWLAQEGTGIRRIGGELSAILKVKGTAKEPDLAGEISLAGGELRLESPGIAPMSALHARGSFARNEFQLQELSGDLGAAPFQASGKVRFGVESGFASSFASGTQLDFILEGEDLLLYRQQGVKVRANSDLRVQGPLDKLVIQGDVHLTDARMVKNFDLFAFLEPKPVRPGGPPGLQLFSLEPPLGNMRFDIAVTAENGFRLKNNVLDGMARPDLRLTGTGAVPVLDGEIYIEPTRVSLPASRLRLESGVVSFVENNPFLPNVDIFGGTRMLGYDISVTINGPYNEPTVTFSSTPPLPQDQLFLLIMTGQPPDDPFTTDAGGAALETVAVYLGTDVLARLFGDESTESSESILSRFEVESGRDATRSGAETIEGRFLLVRDVLANGDALYIEGERDAYEDFNLGIKIVFRFK